MEIGDRITVPSGKQVDVVRICPVIGDLYVRDDKGALGWISSKEPWEDWDGLWDRIEDRFWDEEIAIAEALGEI